MKRTPEEARALLDQAECVSIMSEAEQLALANAAFSSGLDRPLVIEVGTAYGGTAAFLALLGANVITIDNWQCGEHERFDRNMRQLPIFYGSGTYAEAMDHGGVWQVPLSSGDAYAALVSQAVHPQLVIVDGEHQGLTPYNDMRAYSRLVGIGAHLAIDDVANGHPDVLAGLVGWLGWHAMERWLLVFQSRHHCDGHELSKLLILRREN